MKKKQLVCSALAAAMMLSTAAPGASAASFSDSAGHWGESSIDRWSNSGVLNGIDNAFNPNASITRGEMATILAEMLGLEERASDTYPDLNGGWYTDAMLKCAAAGIMTGDDHGQMRPYDNVTGAEIAVILNKALDLSSSRANYPATSAGYVKPWAQSYVDAITSRGIAIGNDGGIFQPMQATSRAAFVSMLDRAVDTYISSPGSYSADGLTIINTTGTVTLSGTPTSVDITESSTGANVVLDRANVSGPINVKGGRIHLTARNATLNNTQVKGYGCTIALEGTTNGGTVQLGSGAGSSTVSVASAAQAGQIISDAASTTINIDGTVNNIKLDSGAMSSGVSIRSGARVESVTSEANDVSITGNGTLRRADIYGTNNRVTTPGTTINRGPSTSTSVTNRGKTSVVRRTRPVYSDWHTVNFYYDGGNGRTLLTSKRVYTGDRVSSVDEPQYNGAKIFDKWVYERYYYGGYYDYDYYYYYDWDYWYKGGDWVWDNAESAYHLRSTDLWYDSSRNEYFVIRNGRRVTVSGSSLYDYYDRYGYHYYDDYWRDSSNWTWSSSWRAYYNKYGDVYHDSNGYFIVSGGSKRYISAAEARKYLGSYYYDDYYYRNGYYKDGRWYYYDKDHYYYGSPYYYNYRVGDTYNTSDRIYGNVDVVATWRECVVAHSLAELQSILNNNTGGSKPIKYTGPEALTDEIDLKNRELYMVSSVSTSGVKNASTISGPGRNGSGGSVTPTPPTDPTNPTTPTTPDGIDKMVEDTVSALGKMGVDREGADGATFTFTTSSEAVKTDEVAEVANKLLAVRKSLPATAAMTVNGHLVSTSTTASEITSFIYGIERAASSIDDTSVIISYSGKTLSYKITYTTGSASVGLINAVKEALFSKVYQGTDNTCSKDDLQAAVTAANGVTGASAAGITVKVVKTADNSDVTSSIPSLQVGDVVKVIIVTTDAAAGTTKEEVYSTVTLSNPVATTSAQNEKIKFEQEVKDAGMSISAPSASGLSEISISPDPDADPPVADSTKLAALNTALGDINSSVITASKTSGVAVGDTITLTDATSNVKLGEYIVRLAEASTQTASSKMKMNVQLAPSVITTTEEETAKKAAEDAVRKAAAEEAAKKAAAEEAAKKAAAEEAAKKAAEEEAAKKAAAEEAAKKTAEEEAAKKAAEEAAKKAAAEEAAKKAAKKAVAEEAAKKAAAEEAARREAANRAATEAAARQAELTSLQATLTSLQDQLNALRTSGTATPQQIADLEQQINDLLTRISTLK